VPASHIALEGWSASMPEGPTNGWTSHYGGLSDAGPCPAGLVVWCRSVPLTTVVSPATG